MLSELGPQTGKQSELRDSLKKCSEIFEEKSGSKEQMKKVFYGWMFASSPSISGLENPIYDLVATGCKNK